ncbi:hypothetical protein BH20CHL5_BH20CHL5_05760 [soil metagenome]
MFFPRDKSTWTLATDTTGQPAVVLRVLATLQRVSERQIDKIGQDDARWVVRLAEALPRLTSAKPLPPELINPFGEPAVTLYLLAQIFRVADNANDSAELARLTAEVAAAYAEGED